ncbi:phosphotransferase [Streptomyces sp. NPDC006645]|uniref:phosphotransferase n=1 Tax=unclassified Streptomyces TaxID=2593676 RepID=UPI0033B7962F
MTLTTNERTAAANPTRLHNVTRRAISRAVKDLWPNKRVVLGRPCPSVTSYVCRIRVDGETLIAKYSWLGMSLVSVLRGAGGTWKDVRQAQDAYLRSTELITAREARNLELLRELGRPRVCETVALHQGVLLTRLVPGTTLADELTARPWETGDLLDAALAALGDLHGPAGARLLDAARPINERSVSGVFRRKFNGRSANVYLRTLGQDSGLPEFAREDIVELVQHTVWRLLRMGGAIPSGRKVAVYGDLKPEHVYVDGPRLHFIDPAVQWAGGPHPDVAKLIGRSLLLAIGHPDREAGQQLVRGIASTLTRQVSAVPAPDRADWLREVLVLWVMDTVNILSTCLSAPHGLPLAPHQQALVAQARTVAGIAHRVSGLLTGTMAGPRLLDFVFSEVEHTTRNTR